MREMETQNADFRRSRAKLLIYNRKITHFVTHVALQDGCSTSFWCLGPEQQQPNERHLLNDINVSVLKR